jgi:hypothetical protein
VAERDVALKTRGHENICSGIQWKVMDEKSRASVGGQRQRLLTHAPHSDALCVRRMAIATAILSCNGARAPPAFVQLPNNFGARGIAAHGTLFAESGATPEWGGSS